MDHTDHVNLLRDGVSAGGGAWADIGAGNGAFTLALADLLEGDCEIFAIDRDAGALGRNARALKSRFPDRRVHYQVADFTLPLTLPPLAGLVMANSLHFQVKQPEAVRRLASYLRPGGRMLLVEYNIGRGNFAVPHPVPFHRWKLLAEGAGLQDTRLLASRPSRFLHEIYSAVSVIPGTPPE